MFSLIIKSIGAIIAIILLIVGIVFTGNLFDLWSFSYFAPKVEQVRYNTFEQSQAYNDSVIRDLEDMRLQWVTANDTQKETLRAIALQRFAVYPKEKLPSDLKYFYSQLENQQ